MASEGVVLTVQRWQQDINSTVQNDKHVGVPVALCIQDSILWHCLFAAVAL